MTDQPSPYAFASEVGANPLISAVLSSFNGADPANLRLAGLSDDGGSATASFIAREDLSRDPETRHVPETATGLAFADAGLLTGTQAFADTLLLG